MEQLRLNYKKFCKSALFKKYSLACIRSTNNTFHCNNSKELKLFARFMLGLLYLQFHKFNHRFQDTLNLTHQIFSVIVRLLKKPLTTHVSVSIFQVKD